MARLWPEPGLGLKRSRNRSTQRWRPRLPSLIDKRKGTPATTLVSDNTLFYTHRFEWSWPSIQSPRSEHVSTFSFRDCRNDPGDCKRRELPCAEAGGNILSILTAMRAKVTTPCCHLARSSNIQNTRDTRAHAGVPISASRQRGRSNGQQAGRCGLRALHCVADPRRPSAPPFRSHSSPPRRR